MAGGLMQLVAYGAQDVYLTGNPQITFWKVVYRRHTNFAVESIEQVFNGTGDFGKKVVCQIQRNGDLITKMFLRVVLPKLGVNLAWTPKVGHAMIKTAELNIGGTPIDKHYGDWMNVWYELARKFTHDRGYDIMIGNTRELTASTVGTDQATLYVPLYFFCCRNDGLALPLIATQYHDTRVEIEFQPFNQLICGSAATSSATAASMVSCSLFVDYVYLDSEERKKFAQASHEYLIEQVQFTGAESVTSKNAKFRLSYNHPCKALYWNIQQNKYLNTNGTNKFLAWNPKDWEATRIQATKRAAIAFGGFNTANNRYDLSLTAVSTNAWQAALSAAQVAGPDVSGKAGDIDNTIVLGTPLPDWFISSTVDEIATGLSISRSQVGDASSNQDIIVRQWDNYGVFLNRNVNPVDQVLLQLNGQDRFSKRDGTYFNFVMPWQCHSNTPCDGINMFSFALNPEEHQPSGTCNMSRIDNATLNIDFITSFSYNNGSAIVPRDVSVSSDAKCNIYATNYNVLRIMSGMAGLAYSN
jgi:hypothetical protein